VKSSAGMCVCPSGSFLMSTTELCQD
jgi:hypothetical protein